METIERRGLGETKFHVTIYKLQEGEGEGEEEGGRGFFFILPQPQVLTIS
jgi:hypothetical protein